MKHYNTDNGGHFAVAPESQHRGILVQIMEPTGEQSRELLTIEEAAIMAELIQKAIRECRTV